MIRGVIFDLGNTLMYFDGDWRDVMTRGAEKMAESLRASGVPVSEHFAADFLEQRERGRAHTADDNIEYGARQALQDTLARSGLNPVGEHLSREAIFAFFGPERAGWRPYPDARLTLAQLRARGLKLGLLSNATDQEFIERITADGGLAVFLHPLLTSAALGCRKPDSRAFQPLLQSWELSPGEVVMVGDWPSFDILGAHRAGIKAILIQDRWDQPTTLHTSIIDEHLLEPDQSVRELRELPVALERLDKGV